MNTIKNKITWISSYPKSGNTWLRLFITAYINNGYIDINQSMSLSDKIASYYKDIIDIPIEKWGLYEQTLIKPVALLKMLIEADAHLMLKTHDCNIQMAGVSQIPSELTLSCIHISRDPRDVALSMKNHYSFSSNEEAVSKLLSDNFVTRQKNMGLFFPQLSWKTHIRSWVREHPYPTLFLKYENLLLNPTEEFSKVIKFLKIDYDEARLLRAVEACSFKRIQQQEIEHGFKESYGKQFFHMGKAGRWKTELEQHLQEKITESLAPEMKLLDYL